MAPSQPTQTDSPLACGDLDSAVVRPSLTPGLLPKLLCWCLAGPLISCFWDCTRSVSLQLQLQHPVPQLQDLNEQVHPFTGPPGEQAGIRLGTQGHSTQGTGGDL